MYEEVLIPTDGSEVTEVTLEHGLRIAADHDARVHALYVIDNRLLMAADAGDRDRLEAELREEGEAAVAGIVDRAEAADLRTAAEVRRGTPPREILEYVEEHSVDLIAMGTHGKTPREKLQSMGSVTERVVDGSPVPVLVVRNVRD